MQDVLITYGWDWYCLGTLGCCWVLAIIAFMNAIKQTSPSNVTCVICGYGEASGLLLNSLNYKNCCSWYFILELISPGKKIMTLDLFMSFFAFLYVNGLSYYQGNKCSAHVNKQGAIGVRSQESHEHSQTLSYSFKEM